MSGAEGQPRMDSKTLHALSRRAAAVKEKREQQQQQKKMLERQMYADDPGAFNAECESQITKVIDHVEASNGAPISINMTGTYDYVQAFMRMQFDVTEKVWMRFN